MPVFFDTHAHLDFPDYEPDLDAVVDRATQAGIERILVVGTTLASSRRAIALAERFPSIHAIVGVHPNHVTEEPLDLTHDLRELARHPRVVALGETGLDFHRLHDLSPAQRAHLQDRQRAAFEQHLALAAELGLNVVIHQRDAFAETLPLLQPWCGRLLTVFHCFTGTPAEAEAVIALGGSVSFTGITTFKNAANIRTTLASIPEDRFFLETDCPFLAPVPHRGRRCEPAYVQDLARVVAEVRGLTLDQLSHLTCTNARHFFPRLT